MSNPTYYSRHRLWVASRLWKLADWINRAGDRMLPHQIAEWEREILKMTPAEWDDVQRPVTGE